MSKIVPIILAGGSGMRLWPVSRESMPKQFLPLQGERSTYEMTLSRVHDPRFARPIVITNEAYRFHADAQSQACGLSSDILLEPAARDSAPAIAAAAAFAQEREAKPVSVLILSADHIILDDDLFLDAVDAALPATENGQIAVFGIQPTAPKPDFGYIQPGDETAGVHKVAAFIEKPEPAKAAELIGQGALWNAGYFMLRTDVLGAELKRHAPQVKNAADAAVAGKSADLNFLRLAKEPFASAPKISIDYALMEKTDRAVVVPATFRWSDIGSWQALWDLGDKDKRGNVAEGSVEFVDADNCLVHAPDHVVGMIGTQDLVVSVTNDAVLVADRSNGAAVKTLVGELKKRNAPQAHEHRLVRRPWGSYDSVDEGDRFKVKRITVAPGASLSLQKHVHRAEHWIIVRGVADITIDETVTRLTENQSIYIPQGAVHRLANPGHIPLQLIEVQTGSYLGEDDIERLEDTFGRA